MTQVDPNSVPLADGAQLTPADGTGAVDANTLTLAEMNSVLGKDFKDKESALKAVKETFNFVGKRREDIEAEVRAALPAQNSDSVSKSEFKTLQDDLFYTNNPQYQAHRNLISKMGGSPAEVVASSEFKAVFDRMKVADEADASKSIVTSNSRLASTKTNTDRAIEIANASGSSTEDVALALAASMNDTGQN
jgi:hypothetical protein